jgi:hypothetical protein
MFRKGGSSKGTGVMSMVEPRVQAKDGYTLATGPVSFEAIQVGAPSMTPLARKEISDILYGGKPVAGPSGIEKAALVAQIASTPGSLYDKITATLPTQLKIAEAQRKEKQEREKAIGNVLAKSRLEERLQTIKSQTPGNIQKNAKAQFDAMTKGLQRVEVDGKIYYRDPETGQARPQLFYEQEALDIAARTPGYRSSRALESELKRSIGKDKNYSAAVKRITDAQAKIEKQKQKLADKKITQEEYSKKVKELQNKIKQNTIKKDKIYKQKVTDVISRTGGEILELPGTPTVEGKADGGRIGYQMGSPEPSPEPDVKTLTVDELRALLPQNIGEDVINLLSTNTEALFEFANIENQEQLSNFNKKYGTNAALPNQEG